MFMADLDASDMLLSFRSLKHLYTVIFHLIPLAWLLVWISLFHLSQTVGQKNFQLLARNVLCGNQLIVRGSVKYLVVSALNVLQVGCKHQHVYLDL